MSKYYTQPANIMPGLQALSRGLETYGRHKVAVEKERKLQKLRETATNIIKAGDPEKIADFVAKNPEAKQVYADMVGAENAMMLDASKRWLINNEDPSQIHIAQAEQAIAEGRDPSGNIEMARATMGKANREQAKKQHELVLAMFAPQVYKQYKFAKGESVGGEVKVGAQIILEDGTIVQSTDRGRRVYNSEGIEVKGKAAADAIEVARSREIENARKKAGEKKLATLEAEKDLKGKVEAGVISQKEAAKISSRAFDRLEAINQNIGNLEEGIQLLREDGANTGVIDKYLPSLKKATIKMDNLQGRLGLDVLRNTTFGALSASELKFALDTAVPKGLQPKDLADWLQEKKESQEKLADYIEAAAIYLGTPGNTVSGWIQKQKTMNKEQNIGMSQEEYDKLPSGSIYEINGKKYRKR